MDWFKHFRHGTHHNRNKISTFSFIIILAWQWGVIKKSFLITLHCHADILSNTPQNSDVVLCPNNSGPLNLFGFGSRFTMLAMILVPDFYFLFFLSRNGCLFSDAFKINTEYYFFWFWSGIRCLFSLWSLCKWYQDCIAATALCRETNSFAKIWR